MSELSSDDVAEDLKVPMRVGREARIGGYTILIENTERAKVCEFRVVPVGKRETMVCVQPAVVAMSPAAGAVGSDLGLTERLGHDLCSVVHVALGYFYVGYGFVCENQVGCKLLDLSDVVVCW